MINYTADCYEMKRESVKFAENLTKNCSKPTRGFVLDMIYGIAASKDIKITSISRKLKETDHGTKLENTVERLCRHLDGDLDYKGNIKQQYKKFVSSMLDDYPIAIFDNTDITKIYGKGFEDLDEVIDGSSPKKEIKPGYPVVNAMLVSKNKKQPIPVYSKIVSTKSKGFKRRNCFTDRRCRKERRK